MKKGERKESETSLGSINTVIKCQLSDRNSNYTTSRVKRAIMEPAEGSGIVREAGRAAPSRAGAALGAQLGRGSSGALDMVTLRGRRGR